MIPSDRFHERISLENASGCWTAAQQSGLLSPNVKSFVIHDLGRMKQRLTTLQNEFPPQTRHTLAIKANPLVEVLRCAVQCGVGLEAASIEEVELAIAAGCPNDKIVFDSPAKTEEEIDQSLCLGIHLNVDNFAELLRIEHRLTTAPSESTIGLRVNPEVGVGTIAQTSVGSAGSKFGVSISGESERIINAFSRLPWLTGLHAHVGSQGCGLDLLCQSAAKLQSLRREIMGRTGRPISRINIGGGLPAAYDDVSQPSAPREYVERLRQVAPELMSDDVTLMTEFGRAVQAGCGVAFSRVEYVREFDGDVDKSSSDSSSMAVIHLGADMFLRPVYRPEDWKHEYGLLDETGDIKRGDSTRVSVAGPLCFAGDILTRDLQLPQPEIGDWIAIRDCGAYTLSMWSRHCSRGLPPVLGYDSATSSLQLLHHGESPSDVVKFWSLNHPETPDPKTLWR